MSEKTKWSSSPDSSSPSPTMSDQNPAVWQDLFFAGDQSGPQTLIKVRIIQRSGQPFLVLPAHSQLASQALALYPAQTFLARLARFSLGLALNFKLPLAKPALSLQINCEEPFAAFLTQIVGGPPFPRFAILTGNPKANGRRFVILLFNENNQSIAVIKAGIGESAIRLIEQEASFLTSVPPNTPGMPRLRSAFRSSRLHALALDFVPGHSPRSDEISGLEPLLSSWVYSTRTVPIIELPAWQRLAGWLDSHSAIWQQLKDVVCHPVIYHGDFTPWNVKVIRGSWQALDWERGELTGIPGWDWYHYVIQSAVLINRESVDRLIIRVEHMLTSESFVRYAACAGISGVERLLVLAYLNYSVHILKQTEELSRIQALLEKLSAIWVRAALKPTGQS
jgi:hypothetical protein